MTRTPRHPSPTVKGRRVACTLRELRVRAGMSIGEAAKAVDHDGSWLSRIEALETRPHPNDVRLLLALYGLDAAGIEAVVAVARQAKQRGWWAKYSPVMQKGFGFYVGFETDATIIRNFETQLVPGLLQTEDYARATLTSVAEPEPPGRVDQQMALRAERQAVLDANDPLQLRVVLDEAVLRRPIGGPKVMSDQILHLATMSQRSNIQVQVLPYEVGSHAGLDGSFVILDFPPPPAGYPNPTEADDRIVYLETLLSALYLEQPREVAAYMATWEQVRADAAPSEHSIAILRSIAADMSA